MNVNELISFTLTTLDREDAWAEVVEQIENFDDIEELKGLFEETLVICAGMALHASSALEVDPQYLVDFHCGMLQTQIEAANDE